MHKKQRQTQNSHKQWEVHLTKDEQQQNTVLEQTAA